MHQPEPHITWRCASFSELANTELYDALQLRQLVFIVEQKCLYLDADGLDTEARHLLGWQTVDGRERLVAYARLLPPALKYAEASIGRVITHPEHRGKGAGLALMREAMIQVENAGWGRAIRIAAQMYLQAFYENLGFHRISEPYLDDGIWHVDMLRD